MKKKKYVELSLEDVLRKLKEKPIYKEISDDEIDFSDMPEQTPEQLAKFIRPGRPLISLLPRKAVSIRLDQEVLEKIKKKARKKGIGYQTLINEILKKAV